MTKNAPKKQFENCHKSKQVKVRGLPAQITSDGRAVRYGLCNAFAKQKLMGCKKAYNLY